MSVVTDLLALVRRSEPQPPLTKGEPPNVEPLQPATAEDLTAALQSLATERAAAEQTIFEVVRKRHAMLLEADTDDAIRTLDAEIDTARLLIERLSRLEPELRARLQALRTKDRKSEWVDLLHRYADQARVIAGLLRQLEHERAVLFALRNEASARFQFECDALLPWPKDIDFASAAVMAHLADSVIKSGPAMFCPEAPRHDFTVEFLGWTAVRDTAYQRGQQAGFSAEIAWQLVDAGVAKWVEPERIPPRPLAKPRPEIKQSQECAGP